MIFDVFYEVGLRLSPKDIGNFSMLTSQTHIFGLRMLESYFRNFFKGVDVKGSDNVSQTETDVVLYYKTLHQKILRIETIGTCPRFFVKNQTFNERQQVKMPICDYNSIKRILCETKSDFEQVVHRLNPLKLYQKDVKLVVAQAKTPFIIAYFVLYFCECDLVNSIMELTMSDHALVTQDIIYTILFNNLGRIQGADGIKKQSLILINTPKYFTNQCSFK